MTVKVTLDNNDIHAIIFRHLLDLLPAHSDIEKAEIKSRQNYVGAEWENAEIRVIYDSSKTITK